MTDAIIVVQRFAQNERVLTLETDRNGQNEAFRWPHGPQNDCFAHIEMNGEKACVACPEDGCHVH